MREGRRGEASLAKEGRRAEEGRNGGVMENVEIHEGGALDQIRLGKEKEEEIKLHSLFNEM